MNSSLRRAVCLFCILLPAIMAGCSQIEPQTGTRVTFSIDSKKPLKRPQVAQLSRYLLKKSDLALGADRARVESVNKTELVLLLPGKKIQEDHVGALLESSSLEFMHLSSVATKNHPGRPWHLQPPDGKQKSYIFTGQNGQRLDSASDTKNLIRAMVVTDNQPVLTRKDLNTTALYQQTKNGWALLIRFNRAGAKKLEEFTSANRGEYLAVFDHDKLINAAEIVDPVKGGEVFLTGFNTEKQVNTLVTDINGGDLPQRLRVKSAEYYQNW